MKLWCKTIKDEKITRNTLYQCIDVDSDNIDSIMQEICQTLDICTPIIGTTHVYQLLAFNSTKFRPCDFIDYIDYDHMELEIVPERK